MASIIDRKKATLPSKPDAAVLAAAAKKQKNVFFSTPSASIRQSSILIQDRAAVFNGPTTTGRYATPEQHLPPPPYTPAGASMNAPYHAGSIRPSLEYACTPACATARRAPIQFNNNSQGQLNSVTTIFPSVIAASEALRINLGLDGSANTSPVAPYQITTPLNLSLQTDPSVPSVPMPPSLQFALGPAAYPISYKNPAMHHVQHTNFTSMEPLHGMRQPLGNLSPNLPPV